MKRFKTIISMIMVMTIFCIGNINVFASENTKVFDEAIDSISEQRSTLHKINGMYSNGESVSYQSTTTRKCNELRVLGNTYSGTTKYVDITVTTTGNVLVASLGSAPLDGFEHNLTVAFPYSFTGIPAGTYIINVISSDTKSYDVSTLFYY